jgi:ubiquinone biosynthesis protein UbiJ
VRIKGDIELGQRFKRILDQLDLDWEEWLSGFTGDLVAFKTGQVIRSFNSWGKDALKILELDAREYLQEEGQLNPHRSELDSFAKNISQLRDDTARLEARLSRIQKSIKNAV